jgi:hypothetical protein
MISTKSLPDNIFATHTYFTQMIQNYATYIYVNIKFTN